MLAENDASLISKKKIELINKARKVLNGEQWDQQDLKTLYSELIKLEQFAYATDLLIRKMDLAVQTGKETTIKEHQVLAQGIYKDHSLPSNFKFNRALSELTAYDSLATSAACETLGLAGAIFKRKWQFDHLFKNLILSKYYYEKGYRIWRTFVESGGDLTNEKDKSNDRGFTAINYTFVNELMAVDKLEEHGKITGITDNIDKKLKETEADRYFILKTLLQDDPSSPNARIKENISDKWACATVAEAYFGVRKYGMAKKFILECIKKYRAGIEDRAEFSSDNISGISEESRKNNVDDMLSWELKTFQMQLFSIAYLQIYQKKFAKELTNNPPLTNEIKLRAIAAEIDSKAIDECLTAFSVTDSDHTAEESAPPIKKAGKVGLALSGGGFRAALFHIGVLAALADKDELRNIEVISCVSGGSIIGAYYYLKLKDLLESKPDRNIHGAEGIQKEDYIKLIKEIEVDFLSGMQTNLRVQIFSRFGPNLKMLVNKNYSRTHRLGELYEKHLYSKLVKKHNGPIYMNSLLIKPFDKKEGFEIGTDNWNRSNKVPQLVLNATSVNTGHNWQFTASWMGEPPGNIQADIDVKPRLRRMYYAEAPKKYQNFRLGYAVGASSCVPVMFKPMPMYGLYKNIDLQLIDGGLHDNQGIAALIEQECKNMIISDASGQLPTSKQAAGNEFSLFYRADNILQERLRELQFMDIKERNNTTQLNRLIAVHLKSGLHKYPVKWIGCDDPTRKILYSNVPDEQTSLTEYGVLRNTQILLAEIRTDLDSFHDVESYALMFSGYKQIMQAYPKQDTDSLQTLTDWKFLEIEKMVTQEKNASLINTLLVAAKNLTFKVMQVSKPLKFLLRGIEIALGVLILFLTWKYICTIKENWDKPFYSMGITIGAIVIIVVVLIVGRISKIIANLINIRAYAKQKLIFFILITVGWVVSNLYLLLFNNVYNKAGRLERFKKKLHD